MFGLLCLTCDNFLDLLLERVQMISITQNVMTHNREIALNNQQLQHCLIRASQGFLIFQGTFFFIVGSAASVVSQRFSFYSIPYAKCFRSCQLHKWGWEAGKLSFVCTMAQRISMSCKQYQAHAGFIYCRMLGRRVAHLLYCSAQHCDICGYSAGFCVCVRAREPNVVICVDHWQDNTPWCILLTLWIVQIERLRHWVSNPAISIIYVLLCCRASSWWISWIVSRMLVYKSVQRVLMNFPWTS